MPLRLTLFLLGQLVLLGGGWLVIRRLIVTHRLVTVWGFTILPLLFYLLTWYGPTSLFVVLGKAYVVEAQTHPWWLSEAHIIPSLLNALVLQSFPFISTSIIFLGPWSNGFGPWRRLEPVLGHFSNLIFGLVGTVSQVFTAALYSKSWLLGSFDFSLLPFWQKIPASGFFVFTLGPQLAMLAYAKWHTTRRISSRIIKILVFFSLSMGIMSFYAFGMRTYVIYETFFLIIFVASLLHIPLRTTFIALPLLLFLGFTLTSLHNRIPSKQNILETAQLSAQNLINGIAYRSGIANDSVILGARSCVLSQLRHDNQQQHEILSMEILSGLPKPLRDKVDANLIDKRLERRVGQCYRDWLANPGLKPDLTDSRIEYFLVGFGPFLAPFVGSTFWIILVYIFILLINTSFHSLSASVAFFLPASAHILSLSDTPGSFLVFIKAALPYFLLITIATQWLRAITRNARH